MRLTCPNCGAQYEVADDVVPEAGRDVQCSNCGHVWFEKPGGYAEEEAEAPQPAWEDAPVPDDTFEDEPEPDEPARDAPKPVTATEDDDADDPEGDDWDFDPVGDADDNDLEEDAPKEAPAAEDEAPAEESPAPEEQPAAARSPGLDPEVEDILRTEAARERAAREGAPIESQEDLGLDNAVPIPESDRRRSEAARNVARLRGQEMEEATVIGGPIPAPTSESARRDRLPDIDEINTTLDDRPARGASEPSSEKDRRARGFRLGFGLVTLVMAALAFLYLGADEIGAAVPQLEPTMTAYQESVDQARLWLDLKVQSLIAGSGPETGAPSE